MRDVSDAASGVLQAMRALDAHRHDGERTLERDYLRALEAYFVVAERELGRDPGREPGDVGTLEAEPESPFGAWRRDLEAIAGYYAAARGALRLARAYRGEPDSSGRRERECLEAVARDRAAIRALRLRMQIQPEQLALPGLAKTGLAKTGPATTKAGAAVRVAKTG